MNYLHFLISIGLCLLQFDGIFCHVFKTGSCPDVDVVDNFSYEKFMGKWYAIEKSQTASSCMRYNFTYKDDGSKIVIEYYRLFGVKLFSNLNDVSQTGQLSVPDESSPAKMAVQFPFSLSPFSPSNFWVMSTDYSSYAAIWSCKRFLFGHFQSAMILSRNSTLDRVIVNKLRNRFEYFGIDRDDFSVVDQSDCKEQVVDEDKETPSEVTNETSNGTVTTTTTTEGNANAVPPLVPGDAKSVDVANATKGLDSTTEKQTEPQDSENMFK